MILKSTIETNQITAEPATLEPNEANLESPVYQGSAKITDPKFNQFVEPKQSIADDPTASVDPLVVPSSQTGPSTR